MNTRARRTTTFLLATTALLALLAPHATARCVGDDGAETSAASTSDNTSGNGCDDSSPPPSPSTAGSDGDTEYGTSTWASVTASWSSHDAQRGTYAGVSYTHACSSTATDCVVYNTCTGSCFSYQAGTTSYARNPDATAEVQG